MRSLRPLLPLALLAAAPAQAALVITIHPPDAPITGTDPLPLKAVAQDPANPAANTLLTWTVETADGGACRLDAETGAWRYHPPANRQRILNVQVRATSVAEPARSATATLVLLPNDLLWQVINDTLNEGAGLPWVAVPDGKAKPSAAWTPKHKLEPAAGTAAQEVPKRPRAEAGAAPVTGTSTFPPATWMRTNGNAPTPVLPYNAFYDDPAPGEKLLGRRTFSSLRVGAFPPAPIDPAAGQNVVGYGVPLELTWDPDPRLASGAQAQGQRFCVGHNERDWRTFDVTGRSAVQLALDHPAHVLVDMLAPKPSGGLGWLQVSADCLVRGLVPFAGSAVHSGQADGTLKQARFEEPLHLAAFEEGQGPRLAATDAKTHAIRVLTPGGGTFFLSGQVATLAGKAEEPGYQEGPAAVARFRNPTYLAKHERTGILVADTGNHVIRLIKARGPEVEVGLFTGVPGQAGYQDGPALEARFDHPQGLATREDLGLFVADQGNRVIRKLDASGNVSTLAGKPGVEGTEDGVGDQARFKDLKGLGLPPSGNSLYVLDGHAVRKVDLATGAVTTLCGRVDEPGFRPYGRRAAGQATMEPVPCLRDPRALLALNQSMVVTDEGNHALQEISLLTGEWTTLAGGPGPTAEPPAFRPGLFRDGGPVAADQGTLPAPRGIAMTCWYGLAVTTGSCLVRAENPLFWLFAQPSVRFDPPVPGRNVKRGEPVTLRFYVDEVRLEDIQMGGETLVQAQARRRARPLRLAYELEVLNGDGSKAMVLKGICERGEPACCQVSFTAPGQGRVVFRGRSEQGVGAFAQGEDLVFEVE